MKIRLTFIHFMDRLAIKEKLNRNKKNRNRSFVCENQASSSLPSHGYLQLLMAASHYAYKSLRQ